MGFGERKAYFLAIRPNPRYATWFEENEVEKKGNHALNPLIRGIPFWITPEEGEELNEEDLPIDRELIEKLCMSSEMKYAKYRLVEFLVRKKFDPYSEVESYKRLDKFFTRPTKVDEKQRLVTWGRMVFVSSVDLSQSNTEPTLIGRPEPMRDIVRGPVKKSM
uniref:SWIRM domain-containing protein n=1 Tax=Angiostrongylus cantonensis TaxID=6313 RepID=A0A158P7Y7_ANGCA